MPKKIIYEVVVGNVGYVYRGPSGADADEAFGEYADQSARNVGRAAAERVALLRDGDTIKEHEPSAGRSRGVRQPDAFRLFGLHPTDLIYMRALCAARPGMGQVQTAATRLGTTCRSVSSARDRLEGAGLLKDNAATPRGKKFAAAAAVALKALDRAKEMVGEPGIGGAYE